jgi:hypothetical protein
VCVSIDRGRERARERGRERERDREREIIYTDRYMLSCYTYLYVSTVSVSLAVFSVYVVSIFVSVFR